MAKATQVTVDNRLSIIQDLLLEGKSHKAILQYCASEFNLKPRQIDNYIKKATDAIVDENELNRIKNLALHVEQRRNLYSKMYEEEDYKGCLLVLKDLATLQRLYDYNPEVTINNIAIETLNPALACSYD